MFSEEYAAGVHDRISGKYKKANGCTVNKFNLNHFGILSFDKMITEEIPDLVRAEMARPENQPQNLDYSQPGPIEKALQQAVLKGYVRVCLIELLLKGAIPYSLWDMEAVVGDQFFTDYVNRYVSRQLQKHASIRDFWGPIAEKLSGVTGFNIALRKIVQEELLLMPNLSKLVYDNTQASYDYIDFLTREDIGIIKNQNIPSSFKEVPGWEGEGLLQWQTDNFLNPNPFLSVEHYLKIDGPIADFSRVIPNVNGATRAVLNTVDTLVWPSPDGDKTIREVVENLRPFGNMIRDLQRMSVDESLSLVPPNLGPILDDSRKDMEIYHIDEVETMLDTINAYTNGLDNAMAPFFGLVDVGRGFRPEVLRRTPYRFIKRERKLFKLTSSDIFDPREDLIKNLTKLNSGGDTSQQISFTGNESGAIRDGLRTQMISANAVTKQPDKFYIVPFDALGQEMAQDSGIDSPQSAQDDQYNSWQAKFHRGWTVKTTGNQPYDPLDPQAPWSYLHNPEQRPTNDLVIEGDNPGEALFKNIHGIVDEATFNAVKEAVNNPEWLTPGSPPLPDGTSLVTDERWIETVIDFTGDASMLFSNPGESMDEAIQHWAKLGLTESATAWNELKEYLLPGEMQILKDSRASQTNADLIANTEQGEINIVGPARGLGFRSTLPNQGRIWDKYNTLQDRIDDPSELTLMDSSSEYGQITIYDGAGRHVGDPDVVVPTIVGFEDLLANALKKNHYKVPMRLLVTQVEVDGQIRQVFSKFVLPDTYVPFRSLSTAPYTLRGPGRDEKTNSRARRFDRILAGIFRDYIAMINGAYSQIPRDMLRPGGRIGGFVPIGNADEEDLTQKQGKYKKVMEMYSSFPYLVENFWVQNPVDGAAQPIKRAKFFSVEKLYSLAAQEEETQSGGVFSDSSMVLDELFSNRGYLMKDSRVELAGNNFPSHLLENVQNFLSTNNHTRQQRILGELHHIDQAIGMIPNQIAHRRVANNANLGDAQWNALYNILDLLPNLRLFFAGRDTVGETSNFEREMRVGHQEVTGARMRIGNVEGGRHNEVVGMEGFSARDFRAMWHGQGAWAVNSGFHAGTDFAAAVNAPNSPDDTNLRKFIRLLQGYVASMIHIFGGTARLVTESQNHPKSCEVINQLLETYSPGAPMTEKLLALPEPFRRVTSAGCFMANGEWRTGGVVHEEEQTTRGHQRYAAFESDHNRENAESARYTTIKPSDLTNEEYRQFTVFALTLLFRGSAQNVAQVFQDEMRARHAYMEYYGEDRHVFRTWSDYDDKIWDHIDDDAGRGNLSKEILWAIFALLHGSKGQRTRMLNSTFKHTTDVDSRYRYTLDMKRDQRFGLNYLYQYNLHDFIRGDAQSLATRGVDHVTNLERCGKVSLSISNMLTWFSQKRSESFYGVTSHPTQVNQYDPGRPDQYIPLDTDTLQYRGQNWIFKEDSPEDAVLVPAHIETPGVMCGFSPFVGDGRYHLEEFIDAYKQYFLSLNPERIEHMVANDPNLEFGTDLSNLYWEPKIAYFHFLNEFISRIQNKYFASPGLPGHWATTEGMVIQPILIPYHDFKYLEPNEAVNSNYGKYDTPENKYKVLKYILNSYDQSTVLASNVVLDSYSEHAARTTRVQVRDTGMETSEQQEDRYQGSGVLGTNFFLDKTLTPEQVHLLEPFNFSSQFRNSGFVGISEENKVFLYQPGFSRNIEDHFAGISREINRRENELTVIPNMIFYNDSPGFYESRFGRAQHEYLMSSLLLQADSATAMLEQQWQCLLEDTGLFFFFENYKRIFTETLFDSVETLLSASSVKDCSRLILNIPSPGADAIGVVAGVIQPGNNGAQYAHDFPGYHPMNTWLRALSDYLEESNQNLALQTLSSEERAYRLTTSTGGVSYSMPLAKFEEGENFSLLSAGGNVDSMVERFNSRKYLRTRALFETQEAKSVVEYIFPFQRYMSMASVYSTSILGGYSEVPSLMQSTKASLAIIMHLCSLNSRQRLDFLEDMSQSEMYKKANDNMLGAGGTAMDCFDLPFNEDMWETFKKQMWALIKQIPSIILRGIADVLDPAYKEMKIHWENCDIKHLRNSGWTSNAIGQHLGIPNNADIKSGLMQGPDRNYFQGGAKDSGDGAYVPIIPAAFNDVGYGLFLSSILTPFGIWQPGALELRNSLLRIVSYVYKGPASLLDPTMAFKVPCLDIDEDYKEKWNHGKYGRYGHPLTPFTLLALMTPELNAERVQKAENCAPAPPEVANCDDEQE